MLVVPADDRSSIHELVDRFEDRREGVERICAVFRRAFPRAPIRVWAGRSGWIDLGADGRLPRARALPVPEAI